MLWQLMKGVASYVPGVQRLARGTGGTNSSEYCYAAWLRMLIMAHRNGLPTEPRVIAELGPGDSLGTGLAGLITGAEKYYAFDVVPYALAASNQVIFERLVHLFQDRTPIPQDQKYEGGFPAFLFPESRWTAMLAPRRLNCIRESLARHAPDNIIQYRVPWYATSQEIPESVDMIYSVAVLEHVDDLLNTYAAMYRWLKSGGVVSHQIDLRSHGYADTWDGHWRYSKRTWSWIRGNRPHTINRQPCSVHLCHLQQAGFQIVGKLVQETPPSLAIADYSEEFQDLSADDRRISSVFVQAVKT